VLSAAKGKFVADDDAGGEALRLMSVPELADRENSEERKT